MQLGENETKNFVIQLIHLLGKWLIRSSLILHQKQEIFDWPFQLMVFDGKTEDDLPPKPLKGTYIFEQVGRICNSWGKKKINGKRKAHVIAPHAYWKKKSIFFDLEYWKDLHIRHILDVMHIEKNVCESVYGTLLNIPGKTKDGVNSRLDLKAIGLRKELVLDMDKSHIYLPPACYTLSRAEKTMFCNTLANLKVSYGYCSNFKNLINLEELKLQGFKSHDCHALIQQLLPLAIRSILPNHVRYAITRFCLFFNSLCSKVASEIENQENVSSTLKWVAHGPCPNVVQYHGYNINNCRFHTFDRDSDRVTQNSGVIVVASTMQVVSAKDNNPPFGEMSFYGVIKEIWELNYYMFTSLLFKCDWVDNKGGLRIDELGHTLVDLKRIGHKVDSFILASQAKHVFYVPDQVDPRWSVVCSTPQKDYKFIEVNYEVVNIMEHDLIIKVLPDVDIFDSSSDDDINYVRQDCEESTIDGIPYGPGANALLKDLSKLTRKIIPLTFNDWRKVPKRITNDICEYAEHVLHYKDDILHLKNPPLGLEHIPKPDWENFVKIRLGPTFMGQPCKMSIGSLENIVAIGTIIEMKSLLFLVSVDVVINEDAMLPIPNEVEGLLYLKDAIGYHILWPKELIVDDSLNVVSD
ncbi:hypothetical protein Ddye_029979 [Dipteronia dyeriana]|uniref:DUF4216 domain-containing protein n=1 Tax=Dipteronia dyeriana TaxID=168575 RepID=A0AAD9TG47_9ROSI|nr:hypothetical protein Ddye_029979 [Dipteronia dyeriana]